MAFIAKTQLENLAQSPYNFAATNYKRNRSTPSETITALYPEHTGERLYTTSANPSGLAHLDKLPGIRDPFMKIKNDETTRTDVSDEWSFLIKPFLLY